MLWPFGPLRAAAAATMCAHRLPSSAIALPHLRRDWAWPCHICAGTGLGPATSAPGLGSALPHLRRDWARPCHICAGIVCRRGDGRSGDLRSARAVSHCRAAGGVSRHAVGWGGLGRAVKRFAGRRARPTPDWKGTGDRCPWRQGQKSEARRSPRGCISGKPHSPPPLHERAHPHPMGAHSPVHAAHPSMPCQERVALDGCAGGRMG